MLHKLFYLLLFLLSGCNPDSANLALGTLERDRISHPATVNEVIIDLPVAAGSKVSRGTVLVRLDNTLQLAQVARATAEVAQAEASLDKLRNGARKEEVAAASAKVAGAKASLTEAETSYQRALKLVRQKLISQASVDQALATRDSGIANLQNAQEQLLELTNGTRSEDLRYAAARLDALQATLASEQKKLSDLTITATRDGILDNLPWNLGERATIGSPLAIVLAGKAPFVRVYVPEPYRIKLALNDVLNVRVDGMDRTISGTLRWISTEPAFTPYYALNQEERARLMYLAEIQLPDSESALPNGIPAQVELP
ncbi:Membrane fusion component of tripartite multidrug efflux system [hydrothermal vent metagenome]|uniref:Membrane fusion component of tripartite multidrug efflux system n=1 Tax=hydrothermal vent metagenome TaxID=652676 RepID=A0A3B0Y3A7_9ZZZZ